MTKVLLDSSAWIHFFRKKEGWFEFISELLVKDRVATCGIILTEVLRGVRSVKEKDLLKRHFEILDFLDLEKEDYYQAADLGTLVSRKGFTVKNMDLLIAQMALSHQVFLLQDDSDFSFIARYAPLKLIRAT